MSEPRRATDKPAGTTVVAAGGVPSWLVAAGAVVIVVALLAFFIGGPSGDSSTSAATAGPSTTPTPAGGGGTKSRADHKPATKTDDGTKGDKSKGDKSKGDKSKGDKSKGDKSKGDKSAKTDREVPRAFVEVYNNSGITGLAGSTAGRVQGAGWKVVGTDNWYGNIPETTVYYPARLEQQAKLLAADLGVDRVRPAVDPMRFDRLTLILTGAV